MREVVNTPRTRQQINNGGPDGEGKCVRGVSTYHPLVPGKQDGVQHGLVQQGVSHPLAAEREGG